jgi:hypothetical protein
MRIALRVSAAALVAGAMLSVSTPKAWAQG